MNSIECLTKLGFDEKNAIVYLALLELGETNIVPLAKKVGLPRNTVVYILETLEMDGFIEIQKRNSRRVYIPNSPEILEILLNKRKNKLLLQEEILRSTIPELRRLYSKLPFEPRMKFYRGQEEIRQIYEDMIETDDTEIWYVGEYNSIVEVIGEKFLKEIIKKRIDRGIRTKSIRVRSAEVIDPLFQSPKNTNREIKYAPSDFKSPGHVSIYGDTVAVITTSKENFGLVIISQEYATIMRNWFKQLWKVSSFE